jgi:transposase
MNITMIGLDIAKNVFQVHGVDAEGGVQVSKALKRAKVAPFFAALPPASSESRRAGRPIIGRGFCAGSATRCV